MARTRRWGRRPATAAPPSSTARRRWARCSSAPPSLRLAPGAPRTARSAVVVGRPASDRTPQHLARSARRLARSPQTCAPRGRRPGGPASDRVAQGRRTPPVAMMRRPPYQPPITWSYGVLAGRARRVGRLAGVGRLVHDVEGRPPGSRYVARKPPGISEGPSTTASVAGGRRGTSRRCRRRTAARRARRGRWRRTSPARRCPARSARRSRRPRATPR